MFFWPDIVNRKLLYKESVDSGFQEPIGECLILSCSDSVPVLGKAWIKKFFPRSVGDCN